jgi:hypothetical protein
VKICPEELLPLPEPHKDYDGWEYLGLGFKGPEGVYAINYPDADSGWLVGTIHPDGSRLYMHYMRPWKFPV